MNTPLAVLQCLPTGVLMGFQNWVFLPNTVFPNVLTVPKGTVLRRCSCSFPSLAAAPALPWGEVSVSPLCPHQGWGHLGTNPAVLCAQAAPSPARCLIPSPGNPIYHLSDWN